MFPPFAVAIELDEHEIGFQERDGWSPGIFCVLQLPCYIVLASYLPVIGKTRIYDYVKRRGFLHTARMECTTNVVSGERYGYRHLKQGNGNLLGGENAYRQKAFFGLIHSPALRFQEGR